MDACAGRGAKVAVGVMEGVRSMTGAGVSVAVAMEVGVMGWGVTGNAVGTGPTGSNTFFV